MWDPCRLVLGAVPRARQERKWAWTQDKEGGQEGVNKATCEGREVPLLVVIRIHAPRPLHPAPLLIDDTLSPSHRSWQPALPTLLPPLVVVVMVAVVVQSRVVSWNRGGSRSQSDGCGPWSWLRRWPISWAAGIPIVNWRWSWAGTPITTLSHRASKIWLYNSIKCECDGECGQLWTTLMLLYIGPMLLTNLYFPDAWNLDQS